MSLIVYLCKRPPTSGKIILRISGTPWFHMHGLESRWRDCDDEAAMARLRWQASPVRPSCHLASKVVLQSVLHLSFVNLISLFYHCTGVFNIDSMNKALPTIPDQAKGPGEVIRRISQIVGPKQANKPNGSIVMSSVLCFIGLLAFGCVAVAYPLRPILITIGIVAFNILSSLVSLTVLSLKSKSMLGSI